MEEYGLYSGSENCRGSLGRGVAGHLEIHPKADQRKGVQGERAGWQEDLPCDKTLNNSDSVRNGKGETLQEVLRKNYVLT